MKKFLLFFILLVSVSKPQPLPQMKDLPFEYPLNTTHSEYNPVISPDGKYIVFQSDRPGGRGGMDIWLAENVNYRNKTGIPEWTEPVNLAELNTPSFEGMFSIRFNTLNAPEEIFFTSVRNPTFKKDGFDGLNIYYTKKNPSTGKWVLPVHLNEINSNFNDRMPAISPDGKTLVFSSDRPGGHGGFDLWISHRDVKTDLWSVPVVLGESINTEGDEIMPYFHYDNRTLYYSSNHGNVNLKFNLFGSQITNIEENKFAPGYDIGMPFNGISDNEGISLTHDGLWTYFSSNRSAALGEYDIFRSQLPEELRNVYPFTLKGLVIDGKEKILTGIESTIKIYDETKPVAVFTSTRKNGNLEQKGIINFSKEIKTGKFYKIEISRPGYYPEKLDLDLRGNVPDKSSKYIRIVLMPIVEENPEKSQNSDRYIIVKDADTNETISNAIVRQFSDLNREGKILERTEEKHLLPPITEEEFEIFAKAEGYRGETLALKSNLITEFPVIIHLKKKKGYHQIYEKIINFEFNDAQLSKSYFPLLEELALHLQKTGEKIEVGGHTDNIGSRKYNIALSKKRAKVVVAYLLKMGVSAKQLKMKGYWYSKPVSDNDSESGRKNNRRVDFKSL